MSQQHPQGSSHPSLHHTTSQARPAAGMVHPSGQGRPSPDLDPIELIDDESLDLEEVTEVSAQPGMMPQSAPAAAPAAMPTAKKITFGPEIQHRTANWKRQPHANGQGSVRVRSFHGKLSEQGLEYMDHFINEWLDQHPEIEVKFVTSSIGMFDGKMKEPAVILQVWY